MRHTDVPANSRPVHRCACKQPAGTQMCLHTAGRYTDVPAHSRPAHRCACTQPAGTPRTNDYASTSVSRNSTSDTQNSERTEHLATVTHPNNVKDINSLKYMNTKYLSKHNHLLYNYYLWATCFDSLESSSGPTRNRSKVI